MESLPVPSVQAMVVATGGAAVPPRYLRPGAAADAVAGAGEDQIPIIDYRRLILDHGEESARLHRVCKDLGFFQLINHSVPDDVVDGMKANIQQFCQLPAEKKKQFSQEGGQLEGYGQLFVVSEDQKLDWADMLFLYTQPPMDINMRFWPDQPANFRSTLEKYSTAVKDIADSLLATMAKNLGLKPEVISEKCFGGIQSVRMNYYPPCAQADKIKRNGSWFPVKPLEGAFIVNIGDIFEARGARSLQMDGIGALSTVLSSTQRKNGCHAVIGPLREIAVDHENFRKLFFSAELEGQNFLDQMKLKIS